VLLFLLVVGRGGGGVRGRRHNGLKFTHLCTQHGDNALPQQHVYEWMEVCSGCSFTAASDDKQEQTRAMILKGRKGDVQSTKYQ
jgi:hypothetical protein